MIKKNLFIMYFICLSLSYQAHAKEIPAPYSIVNMKIGDAVDLEGFLDFKGEILFYTSKEARKFRLVFPYCISGVSDIDPLELSALSRRKVRVSATAIDIEKSIDDNGLDTSVLVEGERIKKLVPWQQSYKDNGYKNGRLAKSADAVVMRGLYDAFESINARFGLIRMF